MLHKVFILIMLRGEEGAGPGHSNWDTRLTYKLGQQQVVTVSLGIMFSCQERSHFCNVVASVTEVCCCRECLRRPAW